MLNRYAEWTLLNVMLSVVMLSVAVLGVVAPFLASLHFFDAIKKYFSSTICHEIRRRHDIQQNDILRNDT
jgi:hypothetical protein